MDFSGKFSTFKKNGQFLNGTFCHKMGNNVVAVRYV